MEKEQFVDVEGKRWWLLELEVDAALDQKRRTLGECWDWTDPGWFTERQKMEEVYQFLELNRSELLRELDEASDSLRREKWLDDVIQAKRPPKKQAAPLESAPASEKVTDVPSKPGGAVPPVAPAKKPSAFGRAKPAGEPSVEPATGTPAAAGAPAGAPPAEPKKPSPFGRKAAAPPTPPPPPAASEGAQAGDQVEVVGEQIQSVISKLSPDELSSIAGDLGLTVEDVKAMVQDPEFASMVAEEQALLESG